MKTTMLLLLAGAMMGCSAGSTSTFQSESATDSGTTDDSDAGSDNDGWGTRTDLQTTFSSSCSGCHGTAFASCWSVQEDSSAIQSAVSSGDMPRSGTIAPADKSTLLTWLGQGAPCSGTKPADVEQVGIGGGAPTAPGAAASQ